MPPWLGGRGDPSQQYAVLTPDNLYPSASTSSTSANPASAPAWSARLAHRTLAPPSSSPDNLPSSLPSASAVSPSGLGGRGVGDLYPVGKLSSGVVAHMLSWAPLPTLAQAARANRNLARAVADERVWASKWAAAQWVPIPAWGISDPPQVQRWEQELQLRAQQVQSERHPRRTTTSTSVPNTEGTATAASLIEDDEFGQFAVADSDPAWANTFTSAPAAIPGDTDPHAPVAPTPGKAVAGRGGSLAHGLASVQLASHSQTNHHAPHQIFDTGSAIASGSQNSQPVPRVRHTLAAAALLARREQVLPILRALKQVPSIPLGADDEGDASTTNALSHPSLAGLDVATQALMLANVTRLLAYPVLITSETDAHAIWPTIVRTAKHLSQHALLPGFVAADARRSDAKRAGEVAHNPSVTQRAVERSEEDMRSTAHALWFLGSALAQGDPAQVSVRNGAPDPTLQPDQPKDQGTFVIDDGASEPDETETDPSTMSISAAAFFLESRALFSTHLQAPLRAHDPLLNVPSGADQAVMERDAEVVLDFGPMDTFMAKVAEHMESDGSLAARVFPPALDVVLALADKAAEDVVMVYTKPLLARASELDDTWTTRHPLPSSEPSSSNKPTAPPSVPQQDRGSDGLTPPGVYARAFAAAYTQSLQLAVAARAVQGPGKELRTVQRCEEVVHRMWAPLVRKYIDAERSWATAAMRAPCALWTTKLNLRLVEDAQAAQEGVAGTGSSVPSSVGPPGAASAKRSALAAARSALLKPVVLVPRAAASAWNGLGFTSSTSTEDKAQGSEDNDESSAVEKEAEAQAQQEARDQAVREIMPDEGGWGHDDEKPPAHGLDPDLSVRRSNEESSQTGLSMASLLNLDTVVKVIQAHRQALRRMEALSNMGGELGDQVRAQREALALQFFTILDKEHVQPAFQRAQDQVAQWQPSTPSDPKDTSESKMLHTAQAADYVAPVVQFTALTHVADALLQLVQVYVDSELLRPVGHDARRDAPPESASAPHAGPRNNQTADFLHPVVREQARFQRAVDARVALGLNLGVDVLMRQAEHLLSSLQLPSDFDPPDEGADKPPDLAGATHACEVVTACLAVHCRVLRDVVERETRDVFFREIGTRLHGLLIRHWKRQVISTRGGWQVIADMNSYHSLVMQHLRLPDLGRLYDGLKMLAHLFVVEGAREVGALVKDGRLAADGAAGPPEEVAELLRARKDYKIIAPAIDKELYGFKVREDCIIQ